jgi:hypothetical protein
VPISSQEVIWPPTIRGRGKYQVHKLERRRPEREPTPTEWGKWFAGAIVALLKRAEISVMPALRSYSALIGLAWCKIGRTANLKPEECCLNSIVPTFEKKKMAGFITETERIV